VPRYLGRQAGGVTPELVYGAVDGLRTEVTDLLDALVLSHGSLTGLADDDHTQYHNAARALTWLGTRTSDDLPEGAASLYLTASERAKLSGVETGATADQTAAEILAALLTVDGAGSGLDADLLDGSSSAAFEAAGAAASAVSAHAGTNTHAQIDTHLADDTKHRLINDAGTSTTELFSASETISRLAGKASTSHVHDHTALTTIGTNTHAQIDTHLADGTKHRLINDSSGASSTELWSGSYILSRLSSKEDVGHSHVAVIQALPSVVSAGIYGVAINGAAATTLAGVADRIEAVPVSFGRTLTIGSLNVEVTGAIASALGRVALYASLSTGMPGALLWSSTDLDFSTTGLKTYTSSRTLSYGTQYWIAVHHSSTATLRAEASGALFALTCPAGGGSYETVVRGTGTFGSGAPANFPSPSLVSASFPRVRLHAS